jgi:hypothetical protein
MPHRTLSRRVRRRAWTGTLGVLLLAAAGCGRGGEPRVDVTDLDWACGAARCTAAFSLAAQDDAQAVVVRVRAYAGASVADREIVGEHRERLSLPRGASRRLTVAVPTTRPADRVRVIVERDRD